MLITGTFLGSLECPPPPHFSLFLYFKHIFIDELHITFFFTIQYNTGFRNKRNAYINLFPRSLECPFDIWLLFITLVLLNLS